MNFQRLKEFLNQSIKEHEQQLAMSQSVFTSQQISTSSTPQPHVEHTEELVTVPDELNLIATKQQSYDSHVPYTSTTKSPVTYKGNFGGLDLPQIQKSQSV